MKLTPAMEGAILHWGEMGTRWGINRTVAQVHALLYLVPEPLCADEIARTLSVARSNVSSSLKELQGWGIVRVGHVIGDRRDHYECIDDVLEMFRLILDERKRREFDPTIAALDECTAKARVGGRKEAHTLKQLEKMLEVLLGFHSLYTSIREVPFSRLVKSSFKTSKNGTAHRRQLAVVR